MIVRRGFFYAHACTDNAVQCVLDKVSQAPEAPDEEHPYFINNPRRYLDGRLKQWLSMMSKQSIEARQLFEKIKREHYCPVKHKPAPGSPDYGVN